jgi:hypothetical protein
MLMAATATLGVVGAGPTARASVLVTRIVPSGDGRTFLGSFSGPAISGGTVAFYGAGGGRVGIYTGTAGGGVTRVADNTMAVPNGTGNFYDFNIRGPSISNGTVAFHGFTQVTGVTGIYTGAATGGPLTRVLDSSTPVPVAGATTFSNFSTVPDILGDTIAVNGVYGINNVAYGAPFRVTNGVVTPIIPQNVINSFGSVGAPQVSSTGAVAFYGYRFSNWGIYTGTGGGALTTIADRLMLTPGTGTQFVSFGNPSILGDEVVFSGYNATGTRYGIYSGNGGALSTLVDSTMAIPGGSGNFATFGEDLAISSQALAFTATNSAQQNGLYLRIGGTITKVAAVGDVLDGKVISAVALSSNGLDGTTVAFRASFVGGTQGIYIGTATPAVTAVPEPSGLALAGVGLAVALAAGRRRRGSRQA